MVLSSMVLLVYTMKDQLIKRSESSETLKFTRLLEGLYLIFRLDKQRSKFEIFGRYPVVVVSPNRFTYADLPVVEDGSLETMLEVPSNHLSINTVDFYLEVKPISDAAACSLPLENPDSSSKRQRTQQPQEANGYVDRNLTHPHVKLEKDNGNADFGNGSTPKNLASNGVAQAVNLTADNGNLNMPGLDASANEYLNKGVNTSASNPWSLSSLWVDDHELRVGLCFRDRDELKKAVGWCSIRGQHKFVVRETEKDEYTFECVRCKCDWSLQAAKMEEHGLVEITKCSGPHTCSPIGPVNYDVEFASEEIECLIRKQPTLTIAELQNRWFEKSGVQLETSEMQTAKQKVIKKIYGDWDESFRVLPRLMAALHSSNGVLVDWQYDVFPNPEFASFRGVFWAFSQSIEGFHHCRPLIFVDTKDLKGKYPMKLMIASGLDAGDCYFPLAFAITKEVSSDTWRWFLTGVREKVTQRKGLCLISSPHSDILAVVNEPGSLWQEPWAYHRFCLDRLSSQFYDHLKNIVIKAGSTKKHDEFDSHMETIKKENLEIWRWLDQIPPHRWALAHDNDRRYGFMKINTEALFATCCGRLCSVGLPITASVLLLFDELRLYFNKSLCNSRVRLNRGDMYTKTVMEKLENPMTASILTHVVIMPLDKGAFQVTGPLRKEGWIVQPSNGTCTCGKFQADKFPCLHALAVCEKLKFNPLQYVDDCYSLERYHKSYAAKFNPVPEVSAWPEASGVPRLLPPTNAIR